MTMPKQDTELEEILFELTDQSAWDLNGITQEQSDSLSGELEGDRSLAKQKLLAWRDKSVNEARAEDTKRFNKLARIVKEYNIVHFVKLYKEAVRRDWKDVRVPIVKSHELTDYEPIAHLNKKGEE